MANWAEQLDAQIAQFFSDWNIITTVLAVVLGGFLIYPIVFPDEPDTHPMLLARQGRAAGIRNKRESAFYRCAETAYGGELRGGLNVKAPDAPKWAPGKDGDLRDIWRAVSTGGQGGGRAMIMTVMGKDQVIDEDIDEINQQINVMVQHLGSSGAKRIALYLPNSKEFLAAVFAIAFKGLSVVILPYNQPHELVIKLLQQTKADALIANAGSVPLEDVCAQAPGLKQITWVVEKTSRHMDWNGAPESAKGRTMVSVWHDVVEEGKSKASKTLPENDDTAPGTVTMIWLPADSAAPKMTEYTQKNLVSGIGALVNALPLRQRLSPSDLVLPVDSFSNIYTLCQTFAALYSNCSLAINSVAGPGVDLALATRGVSPTVVIASAQTLAQIHNKETAGISNAVQRMAHVSQAQAMSAGRMPTDNILFKLLGPSGGASGTAPGKLRLIFVAELAGTGSPALSSVMLSDLRIFTRARICYALVVPEVAGALAQTNLYDYRRDDSTISHFGVPLSSVEVKLLNQDDSKVAGAEPQGKIFVQGPAVVGGEARLDIEAKFREDGTLCYA